MDTVQLGAAPGEFFGILLDFFGVVRNCARVGLFPQDAVEAYAVAAVRSDHVFARLRGGDAEVIDLPGEQHFVERLLYLAGEVEFEHHGRVVAMVVAFSVGSSAGEDVIVHVDGDCFHAIY